MKYFTKTHEWVYLKKDNIAHIGISEYAQDILGNIVYIELPNVNNKIKQNQPIIILESAKTTSDICSPLSGTVLTVNTSLLTTPSLLNTSPLHKGWLYTLALDDINQLKILMKEKEYKQFIASL